MSCYCNYIKYNSYYRDYLICAMECGLLNTNIVSLYKNIDLINNAN